MNREIKFRAWVKTLPKMYNNVHGFCFYGDRKFIELFIGEGFGKYQIEDVELMQYTGLKDKNGKEIYEGDIVRKDSFSVGYCEPIVWRDCMFQIGNIGICPLYDADGYEVIGNIYENPELLTP